MWKGWSSFYYLLAVLVSFTSEILSPIFKKDHLHIVQRVSRVFWPWPKTQYTFYIYYYVSTLKILGKCRGNKAIKTSWGRLQIFGSWSPFSQLLVPNAKSCWPQMYWNKCVKTPVNPLKLAIVSLPLSCVDRAGNSKEN